MPSTNLYDRLSNRTIAFLTLCAVIPVLWALWYFTFQKNVATLAVTIDGATGATVTLERSGIAMLKRECAGTCEFRDVPVGDYDVLATADGYREAGDSVTLMRSDTKKLSLSLARMATIVSLQAASGSGNALKDGEILAGTWNGWTYGVSRDATGLSLVRHVGSEAKTVYRTSEGTAYSTGSVACGYFLAKTDGNGYDAVSLSDGTVTRIPDAKSVVRYAKWSGNGNAVSLVTESGASVYDPASGSLSELPLYDDAIATPAGNLLALVRSESTRKKSLLNFAATSGDILVFEDARERRVLSESLDAVAMLCRDSEGTVAVLQDGSMKRISSYE